ncbi:alpha/beta-hydrolase [Trichoderma longibrachiatum ATCC 18648]|uniref:Alpha/beta-hydrolase n=1 Tax=Trichoderma longibrachiatum ATCC 18648 TaxID=983965 RepID=A0A2T4C1Q5_TRILO|nr:alpha/beta-hydrolase [Trichoderma longibrachiatum ATCC 18648]
MHLSFFLTILCLLRRASTLTSFDDWGYQRIALDNVSIHLRYAGSGPPVLLVHGNPRFSLTWRTIGPLLAENYTVIAVDNRGAGDSVLDFLNITSTYILSHDMGAGIATALAVKHPDLVRRLVVTEYLLPDFGFEAARNPGAYWDLYANWQLAFFSVTDAAEFFISGKEKQMLECSISKPGFLRAMLGPFEIRAITSAASSFQGTLGKRPLQVPTLAMGGEASLGPFASQAWSNVTSHLETDVVPKAGHWIADENPTWVARRIARFFSEDHSHPPPPINLSVLNDRSTLTVGYFGTLQNVALSGSS